MKKKYFRERIDGHQLPPICPVNKMPPSKIWKKKYECKRGKSKHDWYPYGRIYVSCSCKIADGRYCSSSFKCLIESKECIGKISISYSVEWKCKACGKLEREYSTHIDKKFDHSRGNLYNKNKRHSIFKS